MAFQRAEDVVGVRACDPVEFPVFGGAFDAARGGLVDVDVGYVLVVLVVLYVQGNGREADGFACPPADALEGEDGIRVVG